MAAGIKITTPKAKKGETAASSGESGYLLFLSNPQISALAAQAVTFGRDGAALDKKAVRALADTAHSIDVALFGRMVADAKDLNVDAAAQVAHALSVHTVDNEFDYFTALDDRAPEDQSGAGMIGTVEFNSSTLYRYATINVQALQHNLGDVDAAARAVEAFLRGFVTSMPTGKQNTFANRTLPDAVLVQVRDRQPVNLVGAFEEAVQARGSAGRFTTAAEALTTYAQDVDRAFGGAPLLSLLTRVGAATVALGVLGQEVTFEELVTRTGAAVRERGAAPA